MLHPLSWKSKILVFLATALLLNTVAKANFSYPVSHISGNFTLYLIDIDTAWLSPVTEDRIASKYVRKEKNNDLSIRVPSHHGKYKIRFFDDSDRFLFEIRQIRDPLLIVEKVNFRHTGQFRYELYKDNVLVERNMFTIKSNP